MLELLAILAASVSAASVSAGPSLAASRGPAGPAGVAAVGQLIVVTAASHTTTYATLQVFRVSRGKRFRVAGPCGRGIASLCRQPPPPES